MEENKNRQEEENKQNNHKQQQQGDGKDKQQNKQDAPEPDVILDVPKLKVDEINLTVDDLEAKVSLSAKLADFVQIDVGADVHIKTVDLDIKGVEAETHLRVRLERVKQILNRTLDTIDRNPDVLKAILKPVGEGAGKAAGEVGEGAGEASSELGDGEDEGLAQKAGKAIGGVKVKQAVKGIGEKISDMTSSESEEEDAESSNGQNRSDEAEISAGSESRKNQND